MRGYLLGILVVPLLKHCICGDVVNFDGDIKDFVVGKSKLFVLTDHRLHQMRLDLSEEKRKDITNATHQYRVNILVPFDDNDTLITCGTFRDGYCEVLDLNDITKSIYDESISVGPKQNDKSVAFIAGPSTDSYLLVGNKEEQTKPQDPYPVVKLWNTLQSQTGGIFNFIGEGTTPFIQSTATDVEFVDGFQRVSSLYLFLNAKTDSKSESKVHVLLMDSNKIKKTEIVRSLQSATIECCNDKARPVLAASTVIPSGNGVIWAGVFSAQNQQDPENTALALYDISTVRGRVKGFCTTVDYEPCDSESGSNLQPLSVVFKYSSMSSVAAVRSGSWIVLFIGTSDGQLIKLFLDEKFTPGCPIVLYKSDDERAVLPRMHFDPVDFKYIYIALRKELRRVSVVQCAVYSSLKDCRTALDPLCGWCVNTQRCSTQDECSNTSWVSIPQNSLKTQLLSFQMTENSSRKEPEILSLDPNKVSFHGRNSVLLRGRNLESVTKIHIQGDLDCIPKESPVFDRSSDTLRFHIPPSGTKGTVKVCVVTPDDRCHGNSIITYSSQPSCTGIQPTVSWRSGGRKIDVQGNNMESVESVIVRHSNKVLQTHYTKSSGGLWFHSPRYDGTGLLSLLMKIGNFTVDCKNLSYEPDPEFTGFTTLQVANDLQVNIQKKADALNLSMSEVNVTGLRGDQQYQCVLDKIESNAIICKIKGESGAVIAVDSLSINVGHLTKTLESQSQSPMKYLYILGALILLIILAVVVGAIVHLKSQRQMNEKMNKQLEMLESNIRRDIHQDLK
ncbi:plexin-C1-like [Siphateles boraxobius]|uniref:plexin-C1-like n=1 Tax=Siphateles boraxobius TaxID=180520 RepID=UPI00406458DB